METCSTPVNCLRWNQSPSLGVKVHPSSLHLPHLQVLFLSSSSAGLLWWTQPSVAWRSSVPVSTSVALAFCSDDCARWSPDDQQAGGVDSSKPAPTSSGPSGSACLWEAEDVCLQVLQPFQLSGGLELEHSSSTALSQLHVHLHDWKTLTHKHVSVAQREPNVNSAAGR